jgi:hypothetical protein
MFSRKLYFIVTAIIIFMALLKPVDAQDSTKLTVCIFDQSYRSRITYDPTPVGSRSSALYRGTIRRDYLTTFQDLTDALDETASSSLGYSKSVSNDPLTEYFCRLRKEIIEQNRIINGRLKMIGPNMLCTVESIIFEKPAVREMRERLFWGIDNYGLPINSGFIRQ